MTKPKTSVAIPGLYVSAIFYASTILYLPVKEKKTPKKQPNAILILQLRSFNISK